MVWIYAGAGMYQRECTCINSCGHNCKATLEITTIAQPI